MAQLRSVTCHTVVLLSVGLVIERSLVRLPAGRYQVN